MAENIPNLLYYPTHLGSSVDSKQDKCKETYHQTHPSKNVESQRQGEKS